MVSDPLKATVTLGAPKAPVVGLENCRYTLYVPGGWHVTNLAEMGTYTPGNNVTVGAAASDSPNTKSGVVLLLTSSCNVTSMGNPSRLSGGTFSNDPVKTMSIQLGHGSAICVGGRMRCGSVGVTRIWNATKETTGSNANSSTTQAHDVHPPHKGFGL